uniref:Uncharacterized protein n=1 Tax=Rhizophora mucronata TaxID=61149 RepID=A0A2P2P589_RHIMU
MAVMGLPRGQPEQCYNLTTEPTKEADRDNLSRKISKRGK